MMVKASCTSNRSMSAGVMRAWAYAFWLESATASRVSGSRRSWIARLSVATAEARMCALAFER